MARYSAEIAEPMATSQLSVLILTRVLNLRKITHPSHARNRQISQQNVPSIKESTLSSAKDVKYIKTELQTSRKTRHEPPPSYSTASENPVKPRSYGNVTQGNQSFKPNFTPINNNRTSYLSLLGYHDEFKV